MPRSDPDVAALGWGGAVKDNTELLSDVVFAGVPEWTHEEIVDYFEYTRDFAAAGPGVVAFDIDGISLFAVTQSHSGNWFCQVRDHSAGESTTGQGGRLKQVDTRAECLARAV